MMATDQEEKADTEQEQIHSLIRKAQWVLHMLKSCQAQRQLIFHVDGRAEYFHIHKYLIPSNFFWIIMLLTSTALIIFSLESFRKISTKD